MMLHQKMRVQPICGRRVGFLFAAALCFLPRTDVAAAAADTLARVRTVQAEHPQVADIEFDGNNEISTRLLRPWVSTRVTPSAFSQFIYRHISESMGNPPVRYEPAKAGADMLRLKYLYRDQGFFDARIDTATVPSSGGASVTIVFHIIEGSRYTVDSLRLIGLGGIDSTLRAQAEEGALTRAHRPYAREAYEGDRDRILNLLWDNGYPAARFLPESSAVLVSTHRRSVSAVLAFSTDGRYAFGNISIRGTDGAPVDDDVVYRQLDFQAGQLYSQQKKTSSEKNLNRLGIYESVRIEMAIPPPRPDVVPIPVTISLAPRPVNELTPELLMNDENNAFNLGAGLGYSNLNFFGGARRLTLRGRFRVQSLTHVNFGRIITRTGFREENLVANAEITLALTQPYIFSNRTTGIFSLTATADKQLSYLQSIFRSKIGVTHRAAAYTMEFFDWSLERVAFDSTGPNFQQFTITEERRPQFNSILSYTLQRDKTNDVFSPTRGFFNSLTLEEAGLVSSLLKNLGRFLPYSQYGKLTLFGRWYEELDESRISILAWKLKAGAAILLSSSNQTPVPINRRYFGGGSGSNRGWRTRELGATPNPEFGGNALFEANIELRWNGPRKFGSPGGIPLENLWLVPFVDVGNVWAMPKDVRLTQLAVASGIGIRYDTIAGPLRIDYGFRVYDPAGVQQHQWFFQQRFFADTIAGGTIHFGLGQSF